MSRFLLLLAFAATAASAQTNASAIFVGNQGAPASVTYVDPATNAATQLPITLSGFLQGMELINGRLYVTGNGTRIDAIDVQTRQRVAQISDPAFAAARYIVKVGPSKAYVSTQNYTPGATTAEVLVLDLAANTVVRRIPVPGAFPEVMALAAGRVYVALGGFSGNTTLTVIDAATDALLPSVQLGCSPRFVVADGTSQVLAVCPDTDEIVFLDGATGTITDRLATGAEIGSAEGIGQDAALYTTNLAYYKTLFVPTTTGVLTVSTYTRQVTSRIPIADIATRGISAIGYDRGRFRILLGRPDATNPFSAAGTVTVHSEDGTLLATVPAGIFPTHISVVTPQSVAGESGPDAAGVALAAPVPNPAAGQSEIRVSLPEAGQATVTVLDVLGREVARLADGPLPAGETRLQADLSGVPAGVYVVRLVSAGSGHHDAPHRRPLTPRGGTRPAPRRRHRSDDPRHRPLLLLPRDVRRPPGRGERDGCAERRGAPGARPVRAELWPLPSVRPPHAPHRPDGVRGAW